MVICLRTTLNIDDDLMRRVKKRAHETGQTITKVIENALRQTLTGRRPAKRVYKLRWVSVSGRLQPGVDLTDRDALFDLMEGRP